MRYSNRDFRRLWTSSLFLFLQNRVIGWYCVDWSLSLLFLYILHHTGGLGRLDWKFPWLKSLWVLRRLMVDFNRLLCFLFRHISSKTQFSLVAICLWLLRFPHSAAKGSNRSTIDILLTPSSRCCAHINVGSSLWAILKAFHPLFIFLRINRITFMRL